jgi:putative transcriptional regulator
LAEGDGPRDSLLALGYAGWAPGQLDEEIQNNGWLTVPADEEVIFRLQNDVKWQTAVARLGVDISNLSAEVGHA